MEIARCRLLSLLSRLVFCFFVFSAKDFRESAAALLSPCVARPMWISISALVSSRTNRWRSWQASCSILRSTRFPIGSSIDRKTSRTERILRFLIFLIVYWPALFISLNFLICRSCQPIWKASTVKTLSAWRRSVCTEACVTIGDFVFVASIPRLPGARAELLECPRRRADKNYHSLHLLKFLFEMLSSNKLCLLLVYLVI